MGTHGGDEGPWKHRGAVETAHPFAEHDVHLQPACHGEPEVSEAGYSRHRRASCRTSHLAAVQKPPAHRIVVSEHAR